MSAVLGGALAVVLLPALLALGIVGVRRPIVLLTAYAATVPFGSAVTLPGGLPEPFNTLSSLLGVVVAVVLSAHLVVARRGAPRLPIALPVWLVYVGVSAASFAWSVDPSATFDELIVLISLVAVYAVTVLVDIDRRDLSLLEHGIAGGGVLASAYGLVLLVTGSLPPSEGGTPRFVLTASDEPNVTAASLLLPLVIAAAHALKATRPGTRLLHAGGAALIGAAILLTGSRGALIAALAALAVLILSMARSRRAVALLVAVVGVVLATFAAAPEPLQDRLTGSGSSGRTDIWSVGISACQRYCLLGSGLGTFPVVYQEEHLVNPDAKTTRSKAYKAHNIWLQAAVEVGLLGLLVLLAGFVLVAKDVLALPWHLRGAPLAALAALAVSNTMVSHAAFKYFWLVLLYATVSVQSARPERQAGPPAVALAGSAA